MKPSSGFTALAAAALLAFCAALSAAAPPPMLPLVVGNQWVYEDAGRNLQVETIVGTRTILGRTVFAKSYTVGPDAGLENWWLSGPNGEVLLAGFTGGSSGWTLGYEPPITLCGGAPSLGDLWTTHVVAYNLGDMSVFAEFDITFGALEDVSLTLPAGTFPSIGVGQVLASTPMARLAVSGLALDGKRAAVASIATSSDATDWYSPGVGDVQYNAGGLWQLVGYGNATPTVDRSWGAMKVRFR